MKKNILKIVFIVIIGILVIGCFLFVKWNKISNDVTSDAIKFKEDYESLNGEVNLSGLEYRNVSIDKNNPYVYATAEEIIKKIENNETFFLYFGDKQCPWCRSVIEKSIEVANDYNITTIYYIAIWDDEHNEVLRDTYKLDENNNLILENSGTSEYYKLLKYFEDVLKDYTLTDSDDNIINVLEKRIYAPNFVYVKNGKAIKLVEGISDLQTNSREELTKEILIDEEKQFEELFSLAFICNDLC